MTNTGGTSILTKTLAQRHKNTRFVKVDVEDVPFLVERMEIKVLPCLVMFISGVGVDRLLGFEGVSEKDGFSTYTLEKRLALSSKTLFDIQKSWI